MPQPQSRLQKVFRNTGKVLVYLFQKVRGVKATSTLFAALVFFYFAYHCLTGDRGLIAWLQLKSELKKVEFVLEETSLQVETMEKRANLLRRETLDQDMLEESARKVLNMGQEDELMIFDQKRD